MQFVVHYLLVIIELHCVLNMLEKFIKEVEANAGIPAVMYILQ